MPLINTTIGYMTTNECIALRKLFSKYNYPGSIGIEIGSFLGRSSVEIASAIPNGVLHCMDKWDNWQVSYTDSNAPAEWYQPLIGTTCSLQTFLDNTSACSNIQTHQITNVADISSWGNPVDFVFLDAAHRNPSDIEYINFWLPKIKQGGIFAGHDYYPAATTKFPDICENIKYLESLLETQVSLSAGSLWYFAL